MLYELQTECFLKGVYVQKAVTIDNTVIGIVKNKAILPLGEHLKLCIGF